MIHDQDNIAMGEKGNWIERDSFMTRVIEQEERRVRSIKVIGLKGIYEGCIIIIRAHIK